jgi:hypothetical protein
MDNYCIFLNNICFRLPHPVQWCDKIGFCCFSCCCLCIPNCVNYFFDNSEKTHNGVIINPVYSYDDFMMNDALDVIQ